MADSDDEYDRKRRDKFRGERSSGDSYRSERRDDRRTGAGSAGGGRDDWPERGNPFRGGASGRPRPDYRDYRGARDRYSPDREMPPAKRMRPGWGDDLRANHRYGPYDPYLLHAWNEHYAAHSLHSAYGAGLSHGAHPRESAANSDMQTQPAMMTLKQFLDTQDDGISDTEVLRKYNEYKLEFKRQQLNEFFVAHKDEEWFKNKYHPVDSVKRKDEQLNFLKKRVEVFEELLQNGMIQSVTVDTNQTDPLLRVLDTVVIKLEGGTDEDLKILDEKPKEASYPERIFDKKGDDDDVIITSVEKKDDDEPKCVSPKATRRHSGSDNEENWDDDSKSKKGEKKKKSLKRKRTSSDSSSSSSSDSDSSSSSSSSEDEADDKVKSKYDLDDVKEDTKEEEEEENKEKNAEEPEKVKSADEETEKKADSDNEEKKLVENGSEEKEDLKEETETKSNGNDADGDAKMEEGEENKKEEESEQKPDVKNDEEDEKKEAVETETSAEDKKAIDDEQPETIDLDKVKDGPQPRALHRTSSIFLRNLAPSITKSEIEAVCQKFDGFLRVAIADPLVERRWYRRGWVTFKRDVNIKEICWNLNNTRLRDCEMGAIVNRDLSRRVRPVNGMTAHKTVVRADIKLCAKIAMNLDEKFRLWQSSNAESKGEGGSGENNSTAENTTDAHNTSNSSTYGFKTNNPVLQNITDFLIEEASAEEEELLGISGENKESEGEAIERDPQLISVLDNLILYLRIVHSVDFYNHCEYPYEDEMPNRCGIIHARGPPPSKVSQNDIQDYIKNFENKMQTFLAKTTTIEEEELKNLGAKDAENEVEKFIQANTQELAKDKWLCPLSGKKFKGPEFIRKHIFNKHGEKVEEVRKEVEFFNNYLKDPKRPQLPEHPGNNKRTTSESSGGYRAPVYPPAAYAPPYAAYAPPLMIPGRGGRGFGGPGRRPGQEFRQIIQYRDLDAPQDPIDMFN
ncbi:serrate RNA effector molecule homolog isoform X2 [Musca domestica]|uniref:Serrate RNA effector molecule homolog n=1 Tax=Musca domestica TaxID=7370 RepID=A0ABM3V1D0_MUSDO|nr:serrate RNA effector molecule homolog isoform X2 [Musca domestica]